MREQPRGADFDRMQVSAAIGARPNPLLVLLVVGRADDHLVEGPAKILRTKLQIRQRALLEQGATQLVTDRGALPALAEDRLVDTPGIVLVHMLESSDDLLVFGQGEVQL